MFHVFKTSALQVKLPGVVTENISSNLNVSLRRDVEGKVI